MVFRPESLVEYKAGRTPLLDYVEQVSKSVDLTNYVQIARKKRLQYLVLRTPELAGMLWDIAEDIVGKHDFVPMGGSAGRNRSMNVKRWSRASNFRDSLLSAVFDALSTGEGYLYLGSNASQIQEQIRRISNPALRERFYDEAVVNPLFKPVASVTVSDLHDDRSLIGYSQHVNGSDLRFNINEMIHLFFKRLPGKIEGFTLVSTIPLQLELLWLLWTNQYDLQAKGNMPDLIVVAEDIRTNTPVIAELESKLRKYNMPGSSKHGTTVLYGGKYSFEKMERDTELQFSDVGKAVTSVIGGLFRYPKHRMSIKTEESSKEKDSQGNSDRDYWDMISKYQDKISDILDSQLFEQYFGVQVVFDKSYMHNDIVSNTAMRQRIDNIGLVNSLLFQHKQMIPKEDVLRFVSGKQIEFRPVAMPEDMIATQLPQQGDVSKQKDNAHAQERQESEDNRLKNTGKPSGV